MKFLAVLIIILYLGALFFGIRHIAIVKNKLVEERNGFSKKAFFDLLWASSMALMLYVILVARN